MSSVTCKVHMAPPVYGSFTWQIIILPSEKLLRSGQSFLGHILYKVWVTVWCSCLGVVAHMYKNLVPVQALHLKQWYGYSMVLRMHRRSTLVPLQLTLVVVHFSTFHDIHVDLLFITMPPGNNQTITATVQNVNNKWPLNGAKFFCTLNVRYAQM